MRSSLLTILLVAAVAITGPASFALAGEPVKYDLNIRPQTLSGALQEFAKQSGVQIIFFSKVTDGYVAPSLNGSYTAASALSALIDAAPLTFRQVNANTIEVQPKATGLVKTSAQEANASVIRVAQADAVSPDGNYAQGAGTLRLAAAQDTPEAQARTADEKAANNEDEETEAETIVVTSTRVQRAGFTAPTPTTVISEEELQRTAVVNPADYLNRYVPSFAPTTTPSTAIFSTARPAGNSPNMRNLGNQRTLVLVDGRRHVATAPNGFVDIDVIPSALIDHIDVVTGGASAAWGSDAVAGVVNVVFKRDFEGLRGGVQSGISDEGDNEQLRLNLAYGTSWLDGRARFMAGADYVDRKGILNQGDRDWALGDRQLVTTSGNPQRVVFSGVNRVVTPGGVILSGPAGFRGTTFGAGGTIGTPFVFGTPLVTGALATQAGGSGVATQRDLTLAVPSERWNLFTRGTFELNDNVNLYAEASYASSAFHDEILYSGDGATGTNTRVWTIGRDYAFLPTSILDQMVANNLQTFQLARLDYDIGPLKLDNEDKTQRYVLGAEGRFQAMAGNWKWDAYWQRGDNEFFNGTSNNRIVGNAGAGIPDRFALAADAILVGGVPTCRNAAAQAAGCSPLNLIGTGPQSAAALDYLTIDTWSQLNLIEDVFAASISGEPFSIWAGPVSTAIGAEYRKTQIETETDPYTAVIYNNVSNILESGGSPDANNLALGLFVSSVPFTLYQPGQAFTTAEGDVREAFFETVVPLVKDIPGIELLEFNGAIRWTDYSQSGEVETWKLGLSWKPFSDLRLRATQSRDIRAPSLNELFALGATTTPSVSDPVTASSYTTRVRAGGNRNLVPEEADTLTFGVVWEPSFINGFRTSIDLYDVDISDAIGTLTAQQIVDRCFSGDSGSCASIERDGSNGPDRISLISTGAVNSQTLNVRGIDFEQVITPSVPKGNLSFRILANHTLHFINATGLDLVGSLGQGQGGVPKWRGSLTGVYGLGQLNLSASVRYVGDGIWNKTLAPNVMAPLKVASQTLVDTTVEYTLPYSGVQRIQIYANVQNLFDRDPPFNPSTAFMTSSANATYHDVIGRMFSLGARVDF